MSETVNLIIEIPKRDYEEIKKVGVFTFPHLSKAIREATPLDSNSERAEVQAYFDGEAYGWDEGRKDLIDDLKAEFIKRDKKVKAVRSDNRCCFTIEEILRIIDTYMTESEGDKC